MTENKLVEIPVENLPKLMNLYRIDWPKQVSGNYVMDTFISWIKKNLILKNLKIYSLNGNWEDDGTYIITDGIYVYVNTQQKSYENLRKALELVQFTRGQSIGCFSVYARPAILEVLRSQKLNVLMDSCIYFYYISKWDTRMLPKKKIDGVIFKSLEKEHALKINEVWPHKRKGTLMYIENMIMLTENIGAFTHQGELVAWCFRYATGNLSLLHIEDKFAKKANASVVAAELTKIFASLGYDVTANVLDKHTNSMKLLESIGFRKIDKIYWVVPEIP